MTPCNTCSGRGLAGSCVYGPDAHDNMLPKSAGTLHERIHQLESLVISMMRQDPMAAASVPTGNLSMLDRPYGFQQTQVHESAAVPGSGEFGSHAPLTPPFPINQPTTAFVPEIDPIGNHSPVAADGGCLKVNSTGTGSYVGSSHWAAVLDSIAELKNHFEQEEGIQSMVTNLDPINSLHCSSELLYGFGRATRAEIICSMPSRRTADRLVSRYFTLEVAAGKSIQIEFHC